MHFSFLHPFKLDLRDEQPPVVHRVEDHDSSEGSEFLDDGLRMEDVLLTLPEQSIAAGSPQNLL